MNSKLSTLIIGLVFFSCCHSVQAQKEEFSITPLTWADEQDIKNKTSFINELVRSRLGTAIHKNKTDIVTLQRVVDGKLIDKNRPERLQATGIVLGNLLKTELKNLEWMVYEDKDRNGRAQRSRALCVPNTDQCLFPSTMISRRIEVDAPVNVQAIYNQAYALIKPHIDAAHAYQPSKLVRPEYKAPPKEESKNISVEFQ